MAGALPPPGFYLMSYNQYYTANNFQNSFPAFNDFNATVAATVFRGVYVSNVQILGGTWAMHAFLPIASVDVTMGGMTNNSTGIGDIIIDPFILGWHFGDWHIVTGFDITLPTGRYDANSLANPGRNYWTFTPVFAFTWLNKDGYEVSAKIMYDINTKNMATDYLSGQELHADFTLAKHFGPLAVGLGGYAYRQVTPDRGTGAVLGGFEGQAFALGPQISYTSGNLTAIAKYQKEFAVENRPEGEKVWLKIIAAF
ncbi:SphA family protein [Xanthobacter sp. TB0139]|uniref:SphA family protein n=1 Tax=Xanthobacter sp. TB0139 TaxID=3459178 RepID=UPI004039D55B